MDKPHYMTAIALRRAIADRRIGAEELTRHYLARIESYDGPDGLNSVAELCPAALEQARAMDARRGGDLPPLFGLPVLIKDNIDVAGLHTTAGSLALRDNIACADAPVVANLRRSGAIILGKTNMTEFANYTTQDMPGGYSSSGGQVKNAYDAGIEPSGSSSGSAVAVSAGLCAAALGTDTSFSVIGCATVNGVTGLKPSHGALSGDGIIPISHTLDSAGALTRSLRDALLLYSGMRSAPFPAAAPAEPRGLRIAVNTFNRDMVSDNQNKLYQSLFDRLRAAGALLAEVSHPYSPHMKSLMLYEFKRDLEIYLSASRCRFKTLDEITEYYERNPASMMKYGVTCLRAALDNASGLLDEPEYVEALREREKARAWLAEALRDFDACVMTGPTNIMHFAGFPSVALRLGMAEDGTPRGIILYGADEARLFSAALAVEAFCGEVTPPNGLD